MPATGALDDGEPRCIAFGGLRVDDAIEAALLRSSNQALSPRRPRPRRKRPAGMIRPARRCCAIWKRLATRRIGLSGNTTRLIPITASSQRSLRRGGTGRSRALARPRPTRRHDGAAPARTEPRLPSFATLADDLGHLESADNRCPAQEAHCPHRDPRGDRRCRHRGW